MRILKKPIEFEWDKGNIEKNWLKHKIINREAEEVFFNQEKFIFKDKLHSKHEERLRIFGKTNKGRKLFIVFTKRNNKIRIISSRDINRKEVKFYEKKIDTAKV